ncbi:MAG: dephospho-CoA kinase [Bdellovibrionales bacterium]|nr:dephospho-CoA kinase [Bdellovibrionales bacterium]
MTKSEHSTTNSVHYPKVFALTGSIGCGKSTALTEFRRLGAYTLSSDDLARELVQKGSSALQEIVEAFGEEILLPTGELDRKRLGAKVFTSPKDKERLEAILHPKIRTLSRQRISEAQTCTPPPPVIVYEIPLYFESKLKYPEIDGVIVVYAPEAVCVRRVMERNAISEEEAKQRYSSQIDMEEKRKLADFVLTNVREESDLLEQVRSLYATLALQH